MTYVELQFSFSKSFTKTEARLAEHLQALHVPCFFYSLLAITVHMCSYICFEPVSAPLPSIAQNKLYLSMH